MSFVGPDFWGFLVIRGGNDIFEVSASKSKLYVCCAARKKRPKISSQRNDRRIINLNTSDMAISCSVLLLSSSLDLMLLVAERTTAHVASTL